MSQNTELHAPQTAPLHELNWHPLTSIQMGVWMDQMRFPDSPLYNVGVVAKVDGPVDQELFGKALEEVTRRHSALRLVFGSHNGVPRQRILERIDLPFQSLDLRQSPSPDQDAERLVQEAMNRPFHLDGNLMWGCMLIRTGEKSYVWSARFHHLICDGVSGSNFFMDLSHAYTRLWKGVSDEGEVPPSFEAYWDAEHNYLNSSRADRDRAFWAERLRMLPPVLLPRMRDMPPKESAVRSSGLYAWELSRERYTLIENYAKRYGGSVNSFFLALLASYFFRIKHVCDIVIGSPVHNRTGRAHRKAIGMFSSVVPLRINIDSGNKFSELLQYANRELRHSYRHQHLPVSEINRCASLDYGTHTNLYDVALAFDNFSGEATLGNTITKGKRARHQHEQTPLVISVNDYHENDSVIVEFSYNTAFLNDDDIARMVYRIDLMLGCVLGCEDVQVDSISIMDQDEITQVIHGFNVTQVEYPKEALIHELFEQQVGCTPDTVAVQYEGEQLTYAELNAKANQLAHRLLGYGAGRGQCVAIVAPRGIEMLLAQLATLKAGGTYVPIDPAFPQERRLFMLQDCRATIVLSDGVTVEASDAAEAEQDVQWLDIGHVLEEESGLPTDNPVVSKAECAEAAYVMYTSGSTGQPKGVMAPHRGVNRLVFANGYADITPEDVLAHFSNPAFDGSTFETWGALLNGARVVIVPQETVLDPVRFGQLLLDEGVTTMFMTIGLFHQYADALAEPLSRLKYLLTGGDVIEPNTIRRVLKYGAPENFMAAYGPTETTTFATTCRLNDLIDEGSQKIPLGRPIGNTQVYILDGQGKPVPIGVTGEIHIGGDGVALGYLSRPELTAERFVPDPFSDDPDARMYRTGDLGYWRADGLIEFVGRNDFQVKVRGFRIELGEIEARLGELPEVKEVVVLAREDQPGDKRLVAYWTARDDGTAGTSGVAVNTADAGEDEGARPQQEAARLREHLRAELPEYMVPSAFVRLEAMPLNTSGKVDREALPAPDEAALVTHAYEAPQGPVEEVLAGIWQELLGVERVGRNDSFFDLGGHSLLAVQLLGRMRRDLGQEIQLRELFDSPTLAGVAGRLQRADEALTTPMERADRKKDLTLSWAQQRLWFLEQLEDLGAAYHIPAVLRLQGELDRVALQRALDEILARHEALRTVFVRNADGEPVQRILPVQPFALAYHDLTQLAEAERERAKHALAEETLHRPFDLPQDVLIRASLVKLAEQDHVLNLCMHHIVSDGWSMGVLTRELAALYGAFSQGQENPLPALPIQYADYAQWQRQWLSGERLEQQVAYWKEELAGAPSLLELPTDHPRPQVQSFAGGMVPFELDEGLTQGLNALARRHGATLFMVLQAGFAVLLGRLSGQDDVVVGTPVANRRRSELEGLIGFFVNTLALRTRLDPMATVAQLLGHVKERTLAGFGHQDVPFEQVVEAVQPERSMGHSPLFQVMLVLQNNAEVELKLPGLTLGQEEFGHKTTHFDLTLLRLNFQVQHPIPI